MGTPNYEPLVDWVPLSGDSSLLEGVLPGLAQIGGQHERDAKKDHHKFGGPLPGLTHLDIASDRFHFPQTAQNGRESPIGFSQGSNFSLAIVFMGVTFLRVRPKWMTVLLLASV